MKKSLLFFTAILTALLLALPVYAADIRLSSSCLLADAIIAANLDRPAGGCPAGHGPDTIILSQDITLRAELPIITSDITIEGNGYAISGDNRWRMFYNDGGALTIYDLTMTKGRAKGAFILNADESLKNATANPIGGAIVNWLGALSISDSTFRVNLAELGGAIYNWRGELSISDSAFSGNLADKYGALGGAIYNREGTISIGSSTFRGNSADLGGGAIANRNEGELSIVNSAFSVNSADKYGGAIVNEGELSIINNTFRINLADLGGAIYNTEDGKLRIINSIIAGRGGACYSDSRLRQNISNFIEDGTCSSAFSGDPMLGELVTPTDGSPAYFPLLADSRAIDAADDDYCPETDQIGTARPQGAGCDVGAIEYAAP